MVRISFIIMFKGADMKKNRYRLVCLLIVIALCYFFVFVVDCRKVYNVMKDILKEQIIQSFMPAYTFLNDVENNHEFDVKNSIINDIYPMNEYLLSNESTGENQCINCNSKIEAGADSSDSDNTNEGQNDETKKGDAGSETETENDSKTQNTNENSNEVKDELSVSASAQVISRNTITGTTFNRNDLNNYDYVYKKFYTVTSITSLTPQILRPQEFLDKNMQITHDANTPQILIFHTHSQESFSDSTPGDPSMTIVGVGDYLTRLLTEKYGYNVIHDKSVYDYVDGKLDRSKAYTYSEEGIKRILDENPSIEVVIDLHRDGVSDTTHLVTEIDGKQVAKVMLFNGLSYSNVKGNIDYLYNPYRDDNLAMSLQMQLLGEAYYPDFLRRIYCNAYRYCLHERAKSMLIEAGAQTNTFQEEINAMEPLADLLDKLLRGERAY